MLRCGSAASFFALGVMAMWVSGQDPANPGENGTSPRLSNEEAWKLLPGSPPEPQPLPAWARALVKAMPMTTARMLELDALHRSGDRLDARLRGLVRLAAAEANRCAYSRAVALDDLRRVGITEEQVRLWVEKPELLPELDRAAVRFARRLMSVPDKVTDEEVEQLLAIAGEERVVALVCLLAHAAFQDRIILSLGITDKEPPVRPVLVKFARPQPESGSEEKKKEEAKKKDESVRAKITKPKLPEITVAPLPRWFELQEGLARQRRRRERIRIPSREEMLARIGEKHPNAWQADINWSRVCYTHQPELTDAWFDCVATFRKETSLEPMVAQSIFWVVTEARQCFY
jgi:alkylhydroperoxidase family enzyme